MMVRGRQIPEVVAAVFIWICALSNQCVAQTKTTTNPPEDQKLIASVTGCYELQMGRWWPWGFGEDNEYVTPPRKIQLLTERGTEGFETGRLLIREIPTETEEPGRRRRYSYWQVKSDKRVDLIWTNGLSGVVLSLTMEGRNLNGKAHPHFDFPIWIHRFAYVTARRIDCAASR